MMTSVHTPENRQMISLTPVVGGASFPRDGAWIESVNPANGQVWSRVARYGPGEADIAIRAAHRTFREGLLSEMGTAVRADMLNALAALLETRWKELVKAGIRNNVK